MEAHEVASAVAPDLVEPLQPHAPKHPDVLLQAIPLQHKLNLQQGCSLGQHELVVDRQHGLQLRSAQSLAAKFDLGRNFAPGCPSIREFSQKDHLVSNSVSTLPDGARFGSVISTPPNTCH